MVYDILVDGTHKVRVTLQIGEYVGHLIYEVGGSRHGRQVLDYSFDGQSVFDDACTMNNCNLRYDKDTNTFGVTLRDPRGEKLILDGLYSDEMNNMIVGMNIIDFWQDSNEFSCL